DRSHPYVMSGHKPGPRSMGVVSHPARCTAQTPGSRGAGVVHQGADGTKWSRPRAVGVTDLSGDRGHTLAPVPQESDVLLGDAVLTHQPAAQAGGKAAPTAGSPGRAIQQ